MECMHQSLLLLPTHPHNERGIRETGLRGAIGDECQNMAHVHDVGLQVRVGQAVGLLAFQHHLIVIHKDNTSLHEDQVAQVEGLHRSGNKCPSGAVGEGRSPRAPLPKVHFPLDEQVLGCGPWEAVVGKPCILLPDHQGLG